MFICFHLILPLLLLCSLTGLFSGCMVGPDFQRPQVEVPRQWSKSGPEPAKKHEALAQWWTRFEDPTLNWLIDKAMSSNLDIKLAMARISQARAARGQGAAEMGPVLNTFASYRRYHGLSDGMLEMQQPSPSTEYVTDNEYSTGFDASWEIDLFGGVRRKIEALDAELDASIEAQRDAMVTLTAEVARSYFDLRFLQKRKTIAEQHLKTQKHSVKLASQRYQNGFVGQIDVANARMQAAETAARIPVLEAAVCQTVHKIKILLGDYYDSFTDRLAPIGDLSIVIPPVPVGVPSDLLRRRPDIRQAEAQIHSATARIGVATADLFPKFTISGSLTYLANSLSSLITPDNLLWAIGPTVGLNLFDNGRTRASIKVQEAVEAQALITYKQKVLTALVEVEDALIALEKEEMHCKALHASVQASRKSVQLAKQLYLAGETDFLQVLVVEQSLFSKEDALAQSQGSKLTYLISLYKALGGDWNHSSLAPAHPAIMNTNTPPNTGSPSGNR